MRTLTFAAALVVSVAALAAQSGKQFVRPPAGQTPPYNLAIKAGGVIYTPRQLPTDAAGNVVSGDITAQAKQVFDNPRGGLQQAGSSLDHAVSAVLMLQSASDLPPPHQGYR